jgi:hypothetical protein
MSKEWPAAARALRRVSDNVVEVVHMKRVVILLLVMIAAGLARGEEPARDDAGRSQVMAATKDAVDNLLDEVSRVPLTSRLNVGEFLRQTRTTEEMVKVLQRAQQMGGARWLDDHTCQVELEISGPVVAQQLKRAVAADPRRSPIAAAELDRAVRNWDERAFTATGTATSRLPVARGGGGGGVSRIGPAPSVGFVPDANDRMRPERGADRDLWRDVNDAGRAQAVAAAKSDAARRSMASVRGVGLTRTSTVGDALEVRSVGDGLQEWFTSRKPARVALDGDGEATVELAASPGEAFDAFRGLAVKQREVPLPADEGSWRRVRTDFERQMVTPVGRSVAPVGGRGAAAELPAGKASGRPGDIGNAVIGHRPALALPEQAPAWVQRRLTATGRGARENSKLRAARAAESAAEEKLRHEIEDLPLTERQTIGQAAKSEPRIDRAVSRALNRARISRANYHDDGAADVDVYLDLDVLWQELRDVE